MRRDFPQLGMLLPVFVTYVMTYNWGYQATADDPCRDFDLCVVELLRKLVG